MNNVYKKNLARILLSVLFAVLTGCGGGNKDRFSYSNFIVFGASLSDTGNVYTASSGGLPGASSGYYLGRWSNGPLWIDDVASAYGKSADAALLGGTNYAYSGAMTCTITTVTSSVPDMCVQVAEYLSSVSNKADSNAMYVIDSSVVGNEITKVLSSNVSSTQITTVAPTNIENILQVLYAAGARHFLIVNVPDVGVTPLIQAYGSSASLMATNLAVAFNSKLTAAVNSFAVVNLDAYIYQADINGVFTNIKSSASSYGIENSTDSCLNAGLICASPDTYLFWDDFHPTKKVGGIISAYVLGLI
jgi:phospholipase/lecithinase/hemolysin